MKSQRQQADESELTTERIEELKREKAERERAENEAANNEGQQQRGNAGPT